jgi:hypothetical protein
MLYAYLQMIVVWNLQLDDLTPILVKVFTTERIKAFFNFVNKKIICVLKSLSEHR